MTLEEIYEALGRQPLPEDFLLLDDAFAHQTALGILTRIEGVPLAALDPLGASLLDRFPFRIVPQHVSHVFGTNLRLYRSWRRLLMDCLILGWKTQVDSDPWASLRRMARLLFGESVGSRLYALQKFLPFGMPPWEVTRELACGCDRQLTGLDRNAFRNGAKLFDELFDSDITASLGLLPARQIGGFPDWSLHQTHAPFPDKLRGEYETAPDHVRPALAFIWRVAVIGGIFAQEDNPSGQELVSSRVIDQFILIDPVELGFRSPNQSTYDVYLGRLIRHFRPDDMVPPISARRRGRVAMDWQKFRANARATGVSASRIAAVSVLSTRAERAGFGPAEVTPEWCAEEVACLEGVQRNAFRTACFLMDEMGNLSEFPSALLPTRPVGFERMRARAGTGRKKGSKTPVKPIDPNEEAWIQLFRTARSAGVAEEKLHCLYALKSAALTEGLSPHDLQLDWLEGVRDRASRSKASKLSMASDLIEDLKHIEDLRLLLPLGPLGPLPDRRKSARDLSDPVRRELERIIPLLGVSKSTERAARIAVKALWEVRARGASDFQSLESLLACDLGAIDWQHHAGQQARYAKSIRSVQRILELAERPQWRRLQEVMVTAGVPPRDNPVPYFFEISKGEAPSILTSTWVSAQYRAFRSAQVHPPYGRADLAKTLAANAARLDELHRIRMLRDSGLLPSIIGPLR